MPAANDVLFCNTVKFVMTTYGYYTTAVWSLPNNPNHASPDRQLAVNVTCPHQSKESIYLVIIKPGNERRDYVTVNYR